MYRMIVVDDEARQCRGLKNIILRLFEGCSAEAFTRAEDALDFLKREGADVVITDICMPEMDGLAFTEQIRRLDGRVKVILLTGYAEFEYARKAVSLGAFDYLLKPLDPDRMKAVLERAFAETEKERFLQSQREKLEKQLDMTLPVYMEKLLNQWIYGQISGKEREEIKKILSQGQGGFLIAVKFGGLNRLKERLAVDLFEDLRKRLAWWMRARLVKEDGKFHVLSFFDQMDSERMVTVVTCGKSLEYPQILKKESWMEGWNGELGEYAQELDPALGLSELTEDVMTNAESLFLHACEALEYRFYFPGTRTLYASWLLPRRLSRIQISLAEEEMIRHAVGEGNAKEALKILESVLERCLRSGYLRPAELIRSCENLLSHISLTQKSKTRFEVKQLQSYEALLKQAEAFLRALAEEAAEKRNGKNAAFSGEFARWLEEHYAEQVSLEDVAAHFGLTPAYISSFIREQTGNSFVKSLLRVRMDKARKLLAETDRRIYEIALLTGYEDVKYFNRVFKKETGVTPAEYRETAQGLSEER